MDTMMEFVLGWTLVCAFAFTVVITCLSLPGWVRFADPKQQRKLFYTLIVEVVVGFGARYLDLVSFSPASTSDKIAATGANRVLSDVLKDTLKKQALTREQASILVERISAPEGSALAIEKQQLREQIAKLPAGTIDAESAAKITPRLSRIESSTRQSLKQR